MIRSRRIVTLHSCKESKISELIQVTIEINQVFKLSLIQNHKYRIFIELEKDLHWDMKVKSGHLEVKIKTIIGTSSVVYQN
jgi:hypothetical protein